MPMAARAMISNWPLMSLAARLTTPGMTPRVLSTARMKKPMMNQGTPAFTPPEAEAPAKRLPSSSGLRREKASATKTMKTMRMILKMVASGTNSGPTRPAEAMTWPMDCITPPIMAVVGSMAWP